MRLTRTRHVRTTSTLKLFSRLTVVFTPFYYRLYVSEDLIGLSLHQNIGMVFRDFVAPPKQNLQLCLNLRIIHAVTPDVQRLSAFRDTIVMNVYGMIVL